MKYIIALIMFVALSNASFAQGKPMYLQQRTPPPAVLVSADSATQWNLKAKLDKDKPLLIICFNPDCDHCQAGTEDLVKNISKFKGIQILMVTSMPLKDMKVFAEKYKLAENGITAARDIAYVMNGYYEMKTLPYLAFYDKNKKLISTFEGALSTDGILKTFGR